MPSKARACRKAYGVLAAPDCDRHGMQARPPRYWQNGEGIAGARSNHAACQYPTRARGHNGSGAAGLPDIGRTGACWAFRQVPAWLQCCREPYPDASGGRLSVSTLDLQQSLPREMPLLVAARERSRGGITHSPRIERIILTAHLLRNKPGADPLAMVADTVLALGATMVTFDPELPPSGVLRCSPT